MRKPRLLFSRVLDTIASLDDAAEQERCYELAIQFEAIYKFEVSMWLRNLGWFVLFMLVLLNYAYLQGHGFSWSAALRCFFFAALLGAVISVVSFRNKEIAVCSCTARLGELLKIPEYQVALGHLKKDHSGIRRLCRSYRIGQQKQSTTESIKKE